jgi:hypothetical protein
VAPLGGVAAVPIQRRRGTIGGGWSSTARHYILGKLTAGVETQRGDQRGSHRVLHWVMRCRGEASDGVDGGYRSLLDAWCFGVRNSDT